MECKFSGNQRETIIPSHKTRTSLPGRKWCMGACNPVSQTTTLTPPFWKPWWQNSMSSKATHSLWWWIPCESPLTSVSLHSTPQSGHTPWMDLSSQAFASSRRNRASPRHHPYNTLHSEVRILPWICTSSSSELRFVREHHLCVPNLDAVIQLELHLGIDSEPLGIAPFLSRLHNNTRLECFRDEQEDNKDNSKNIRVLIVASVLIASRLLTHVYVFVLMLFSLEFSLCRWSRTAWGNDRWICTWDSQFAHGALVFT